MCPLPALLVMCPLGRQRKPSGQERQLHADFVLVIDYMSLVPLASLRAMGQEILYECNGAIIWNLRQVTSNLHFCSVKL